MPDNDLPRVYYIMDLDIDTYEPVVDGEGNSYIVPSYHPVTGKYLQEPEALSFALMHGYLGRGFESKGRAYYNADKRLREGLWRAPEGNEALVEAFVGVENHDRWRHMPFNPGGRAVDGFQYPLYDAIFRDISPSLLEDFDFPIEELRNPRGPSLFGSELGEPDDKAEINFKGEEGLLIEELGV